MNSYKFELYYKYLLLIFSFIIQFKIYPGDKDIVVVESYSKEYKWDADYTKEITEKFGSSYNVTFFEMNTKKLPKTEHEKIASKALNLIEKTKPKIVILGDDAALKYLGQKLEDSKIKTVYLGINNNPRSYFKNNPKYVTGILERPIMKKFPDLLKEIYPNIKKVLILFDDDITSEVVYNESFSDKTKSHFPELNYDIFLISKFSEWQKKINEAKNKYDAIIIGTCSTLLNSDKSNMNTEKVINWTSENTQVPLFAFWDFAVGKNKAVGGLVLTASGQGKAAAELVEKLIQSPDIVPSSIFPIFLQEGKYLFSNYELKKKNIKLPQSVQDKSTFIE